MRYKTKHKITAVSLEQLLINTLISSIVMLIIFQIYGLINNYLLNIQKQLNTIHTQITADFWLRTIIKASNEPITVCKANKNNCLELINHKILALLTEQQIKPSSYILIINKNKIFYIANSKLYIADLALNRAEAILDNIKDLWLTTIEANHKPQSGQILNSYILINLLLNSNLNNKQITIGIFRDNLECNI